MYDDLEQDYLDDLRREDVYIRKAERLSLIHGHDPQFEDAWFMRATNKKEGGEENE